MLFIFCIGQVVSVESGLLFELAGRCPIVDDVNETYHLASYLKKAWELKEKQTFFCFLFSLPSAFSVCDTGRGLCFVKYRCLVIPEMG